MSITYWFVIREKLQVRFVHSSKVRHVGQIDVTFDDVVQFGAGICEDAGDDTHDLSLCDISNALVIFKSEKERCCNLRVKGN